MELEELMKQLLQAELAKTQAATAAAAAETQVQKAAGGREGAESEPEAVEIDMDALVEKMSAAIAPKLEEMVQKAVPAPVREEGVGRAVSADKTGQAGVAGATSEGRDAESIQELVQKAGRGHKSLSIAERNAIFALTARVLGDGLHESSKDD